MSRQATAIRYRDEILERVAAGEYLASIARSLGLKGKGQSLCDFLSNDPEYIAAREAGLDAKMVNREGELEAAPPADVPRARELLSHARWRAERECPARWGRTDKLQVEHVGDLGDRLRRAKERIIDAEPATIDAEQQALPKPK